MEHADGSFNDDGRLKRDEAAAAHVLVFPLPAQGHINSMLRLAELLCLSGIKHVTFVNTHHNHRLLVANNSDMSSRHHPGIQFRSISDGLPDDLDAGVPRPASGVWELHRSLAAVSPPQLLAIVGEYRSSKRSVSGQNRGRSAVGGQELLPPVTCAIVDGFMSFATDTFLEAGIPVVVFRMVSACSFWVYHSFPDLIHAGELPFPDDNDGCDLDEPIRSIPGMEPGLLRRRDLPTVTRVKDDEVLKTLYQESRRAARGTVFLLNTFEAMESSVLATVRSQIPQTIAIGPTHALLQHLRSNPLQLDSEVPTPPTVGNGETVGNNPSGNIRMSLWEEDQTCITWLDEQPPKSVVYVSFGSFTIMTKEQVLEFWHGLLASGQRFLWVLRSDVLVEAAAVRSHASGGSKTSSSTVTDHVHLGNSLRRRAGTTVIPPLEDDNQRGRYMLVNWAPQEEVLNHPSVGGFFTHCGWNSTLESAVAGVPMLCWPFFADQHVNSRFVEHVWKVGIDIKDVYDRDKVAGAVRDLMEGPKAEELRAAASKLAEAAKAAVAPGGSSYSDFQKLVRGILLGDFSR